MKILSYNFLIMGGDERQIYCGNYLEKAGNNVFFKGFGNRDNFKNTPIHSLILPAPLSKDGVNISAPLSDEILPIDNIFTIPCSDFVFSGKSHILSAKKPPDFNAKIYDLLENDEYNILNAVATAEAAISIIVKNTTFNM